ncbi:hypothetical protein [Phenylobacterium sp.]|uniref:hypothetical protein n=1 Tax=Phenylobacterium sp. TaxID=1871053 RepID=UPI00391DCACF
MTPRDLTAMAVFAVFAAGPAAAQTVVSTGVVVRGVTVPGAGVPGMKVPGRTCDFSGEETYPNGRMTGASVQCRAGGNLANTIPGLPQRFNAYCVIDASTLKGAPRLITAPIPGDANHCDLSGITPKDATGRFGGAIWR